MVQCPNCQQSNPEDASYCRSCGQQLTATRPVETPTKRKKPWLAALLNLIAVVVFFVPPVLGYLYLNLPRRYFPIFLLWLVVVVVALFVFSLWPIRLIAVLTAIDAWRLAQRDNEPASQ